MVKIAKNGLFWAIFLTYSGVRPLQMLKGGKRGILIINSTPLGIILAINRLNIGQCTSMHLNLSFEFLKIFMWSPLSEKSKNHDFQIIFLEFSLIFRFYQA